MDNYIVVPPNYIISASDYHSTLPSNHIYSDH